MSAIFSLVLFGLLYFKETRQYLVLIIALEIGIFSIIIYCIWAIVNRERLLDKMKDPNNYVLKFDSCPDYYVKKFDTTLKKDFCSNEYIVYNKLKPLERVIMKIVDADKGFLPSSHVTTFYDRSTGTARTPEPSDKFLLDSMYDSVLKSNKERCDVIDPAIAERADGKLAGYKYLPWTSVKSRCNGLYGKY
jgi:hypothetical protein